MSETKIENPKQRDQKRYLWLMSVLTPVVSFVSALALLFTENLAWTVTTFVIYFGFIPLADMIFGEDDQNLPDNLLEEIAEDPYYRILLFCSVPIFYASLLVSAYVVATMSLPVWAFMCFTIGVGVSSGIALTVGHELGHKLNKLDQFGAKMANALTGYAHFNIEHNRGHHIHVATPEDPASAKLGESVYRFALRELPGTAKRGWALEKKRLAAKGISIWSLRHNDLLQGYSIAAVLGVALIATFGWIMIPFLLIHHLVGWLQLTFANYVEHYGLKRQKLENGRYEPCHPHHSWNSNFTVSNLFLFHLQRHSDHHSHPLRPYQVLRNFDGLPHLPSGYPGCFVLAAIPPIWFHIMDPKVMSWACGDIEKTNRFGSYMPAAA